MIQIKTARNLLYAWHSGQWSPIYAAASSGLVLKWRELFAEVSTIDEPTSWQKNTFRQFARTGSAFCTFNLGA